MVFRQSALGPILRWFEPTNSDLKWPWCPDCILNPPLGVQLLQGFFFLC